MSYHPKSYSGGEHLLKKHPPHHEIDGNNIMFVDRLVVYNSTMV